MLLLFVCTGNTCRSPIAAALFNHANIRPEWHAESAGLAAFSGEPASMPAVAALQIDFGLDLSAHRARPTTGELLAKASLILTMTVNQRNSLRRMYPEFRAIILTIGELAGEPDTTVSDPFGGGVEEYQQTAAALLSLIEKIIPRLP